MIFPSGLNYSSFSKLLSNELIVGLDPNRGMFDWFSKGSKLTYVCMSFNLQMAAVAALCVQYEADFRPNMTIVVKALQPLLNVKTGADQ